jgi:tRNA modification GTPase
MDTIFALASAQGKAGVSVVRISGPLALEAANLICDRPLPEKGRGLRVLRDADGNHLDEALVLTFKAPASFTGENIVELQVHGSTAVVSSVLDTLSKTQDLRLAEPGEFTRRALENGKLDLAQVEGLADLEAGREFSLTEARKRLGLK